ncbi:MAG: DNA recombination protein RmuC [Lentimicrobium sp.]|nr:DNA recombination protein RmuC [Lentimicrobium sp.]MEA5111216.1 DNA recombination protein RmuC [Lentimicrobium sp.]HCT70428.1 DNA recombination protein RmuC [Bacteroidales bacterium]
MIVRTLDEKIGSLIIKVDDNNKTNRETLVSSLKDFTLEQRGKFDELKGEQKELTAKTVEQLEKITAKVEEKLNAISQQSQSEAKQMREAVEKVIKDFQASFDKNVESFNSLQREKFGQLEEKQQKLVESTEKKLEEMRITVDEKLQKTLSERLGQSFELVGKQLESVQKGLGEMQTLAQDVGGLKRVLSNVKMRGGFGEVQLAMLLEQVLAPEQYEANVMTKKSSSDVVEFAIKLPGKDDITGQVWLPVDAKFPRDAYEQLQNAYENGDVLHVETAQKMLEATIKKMAKDISEKYIDPPATTDFAIMFLPFEGIYAEVVRKASLLEELQRSYKVIVTGPTTLAAILNSLQMGFRTLAIQKRSSEVWKILGAVKKEFENFGGMLEKAQKNIQTASNQIDEVMGKRTRAIQRKLKGVEVLGEAEAQLFLPDMPDTDNGDDDTES